MDSNFSLFKILKIISISYSDLSSGDMDISFDNSWVMVFSEKENVSFFADDRKCEVGKNSVYLFPPKENLRISASRRSGSERIFIIAMKIVFFEKNLFPTPYITCKRTYEYLLPLIAKEAKKAYKLTCGNTITDFRVKNNAFWGAYQVISIYIEQFLIGAFESKSLKEKHYPGNIKNSNLLTAINNYLMENLDKNLTNEDISKEFKYSASTINKLFKSSFNRTLHAHFLYLKIEAAKKMLREEKTTVYKISESLGFCDPQNFSKTFKKHTGITPNDYINRIKNSWGQR